MAVQQKNKNKTKLCQDFKLDVKIQGVHEKLANLASNITDRLASSTAAIFWFVGIPESASKAEFPVSLATMLALRLNCSTEALTTHQKVSFN